MNWFFQRVLFSDKTRLICFSLLVFGFSCKSRITNKTDGILKPSGLVIENIRNTNTISIIDAKPEFGWVLPSRIKTQVAYQILIASSKSILEKNSGDMWNSEKVLSSNSITVEYQGTPLKVGQTYFWKVKVWGDSHTETAFSDSQSFKLGKSNTTITTSNSFQVDSIKPVKTYKTANDAYLIDFGKDAFANLLFQYETKENDTLIIRIGEQLLDGLINRKPQGTIRYQEIKVPVNPRKHAYILPIKSDKRNTKKGAIILPDSFPVLMPFRYAEIENYKQSFSADNFTQLAYHSYWEDDESYFESSDTILNQVWDLCKYSIKVTTFAGVYVDGDRERIPYEADAYLNQLSHYNTDREYAMARQTIEYFMEHPTWPTEWQLHVALMFHADYMYTGNTELIKKYYEDLKHKTLMELQREDGLISSSNATPEFMIKLGFKNPNAKLKDIVDWPPAQKDTGWKLATEEGERDGFVFKPINTVVNCLYYRNLEILAEFAQLLNKQGEAKGYRDLAAEVKLAINTILLDENKGYYRDGEGTNHAALHSNMMALAFNIVPEKHIPSVANFIKSRGMSCSVYGSQYLLEALYNANKSDYALDLMRSTENRSWYNMIRIGSTITLEAWDMKYKPNSDWNHAWGATPANIIPRSLWGIQPKTPGFKVAKIQPQWGDLTFSKIKVPTVMGSISANFNVKENSEIIFNIDVPGGMTAEFVLPNYVNDVYLNNQKVNKNSILILHSGISTITAKF
ncbi:alpha-L-rhamnosidase C-terminal domain-containing protein [Algibacter sp. AS12]|uniref:alpha-L-rhamnosidase-related protein n=1 Tax=Algibacter sp. AS12 TaxID=3135773 RepID=UPI00398B3CC4